ncbi:MAG: hypothetical protein AAF456_01000 [Planctomycetota bacterium]
MNERRSKTETEAAPESAAQNGDSISRRSAVGRMAAIGGAVSAMGIMADSESCEAATPNAGSLIDLGLDDLTKLVGTDFQITGPVYDPTARQVSGQVRLFRIDQNNWVLKYDQPEHPHKHACPLSVMFACSERIEDATYRLSSRKTAPTDLYIHYVGQQTAEGALLYEAVIY